VVPPLTGVAVNVTDVPAQIAPAGAAAIVTVGVTLEFTVIVTGALLAVGAVVQLAFDVRTTVTASPFASDAEVKVELFVPVFDPLTFHWYEGVVPPLTGVAVNVTEVPEHIGPAGRAVTETVGVTFAFTTIVIGELLAVGVVTQVAFEVSTTATTSPFAIEAEVKVGLFVPVFVPLTLH
jgi:hypothetical protein